MNGRVLLIEDLRENRALLRARLKEEGIDVMEAANGEAGIRAAVRFIPQVVLLSVSLPDVPGIKVAERLRAFNRTKHSFLMMIGDAENRDERLACLNAGANDFVTMPLDPDLIALRVCNAIKRRNQESTTDPITGLPAGKRVQEELMRLVRDPEGPWALLRFRLLHLDPLRERHGFAAADALIQAVARTLAEALGRDEVENDFLGYGGNNDFLVITERARARTLADEIALGFRALLEACYDPTELDRNGVQLGSETYPLAELRTWTITPEDGPFYDFRSLGEALAG